jgi:hypothetical protein
VGTGGWIRLGMTRGVHSGRRFNLKSLLYHCIELRSILSLQRVKTINLASKNREAVGVALKNLV